MFGSQVLDVVIGLVFIYFLLSIICTAANEMIAALFSLRGRNLAKGIAKLLSDNRVKGLAELFYDHPLIKCLSKGGKKPSYIPSRTFALAFLNGIAPTVKEGSNIFSEVKAAVNGLPDDSELKRVLLLFLQDAEDDIDKFRTNIETWFNGAMSRVSGWYKRKTQVIILILALFLTGITNADTIQMVKSLSLDPALRTALVAQAQQFVEHQSVGKSEAENKSEKSESTINVPSSGSGGAESNTMPTQKQYEVIMQTFQTLQQSGIPLGWLAMPKNDEWVNKIIGLLLTIFAVSLGAPFWFDVLNRVSKIRAAGTVPEVVPKSQQG